LARIPADGETRGNLAAGGSGITMALTDKEKAIAERIGPKLKEKGLYFVGLDVIGDYVTEINVTSPTCVREISRDSGIDVADQLITCLLQKVRC
jgi:glutathione synthase